MVVGGAVAAAIGVAVKSAADFEQQLSRVKAISGATESEFIKLRESALNLGASTTKSASEVAIAMEGMAASGFNANEIMSAMPGIIAASEAAGADLGKTAEVVASAINGFGLEAKDASRIADVLSTSANISAADIDTLGQSFKYIAPVASQMGYDIEEVSAAIGLMSDAGLDGSSAGTSLRASLLALSTPSKQQAELMEELGLQMENGVYSADSLSQMVGELETATEGMTEAEKVATISRLVGTEASAGMLTLMAAGPAVIDDMTGSLKDSAGAAQATADVMSDNLYGSLDELSGALESLGIELGEEFIPLFRDLIDAGAELVSWISGFDTESMKMSLAFVGITAAVAATLATVGKLTIALSAFAMSPVGAAIVGVSLLAGVIGTAALASDDMKQVTFETTDALIAEQEALNNSVGRYEELKGAMELSTDELKRFVDINAELKQTTDPEVLTRLKDEQAALLEKSTLTNEEFTEFLGLNEELIATMPEATTTISDQGYALLDSTEAAKGMNAEMMRKIELELEAQLATAQANEVDNLRKQEDLQKKINDLSTNKITLDETIRDAQADLAGFQRQYNDAKAAGDDREASMLEGKISQQEAIIEGAMRTRAEEAELIIAKMEELEITNENIGKLEEAKDRMKDLALAQVGLNAEKGQEIEAINEAIALEKEKKRQLERNTPAAAQNTQEFREAVYAIDEQIRNLGVAKSKVTEITGAANLMNASLGKNIYKNVYVKTHGGGGGVTREINHSGGIAGAKTLPKLHNGGFGFDAVKDTLSAPMQHEVDVRMLRGEMIITESQQANLMRMLDAGHTNAGSSVSMTETNSILRTIAQGVGEGKNVRVVLSDDVLFESTQGKLVDEINTKKFTGGLRD